MEKLSLMAKLLNIFNLFKNPVAIIAAVVLIIIIFIILANIASDNHQAKKIKFIVYILSLIIIFILFSTQILKLNDNLFENIVKSIYFPSMALYLIMIFIANIIFIKDMTKKYLDKRVIINSVFYLIIMLLFILFLIEIKDIKISESLDVYLNVNTKSILEMTSIISIIWYILLLINLIVDKLTVKEQLVVRETNFRTKPTGRLNLSRISPETPIRYKEPFTKEEYILILKLLKEYYESKLND